MTVPVPPYPTGHNLLAGRDVLITAAAGTGIGFATAKRCVEEGARVMLSDIHERRLAEAAEKIAEITGEAPPTALCNIAEQDDVDALWEAAESALGGIDVLINNAGLGGHSRVVDMSDEEWSKVLDITLTGTFRMTRAAFKHMFKNGGGVIVNNASVLGWRAQEGQAHYAAAKAGVMALTRCSAVEGAEHNVRVNAVAPSLALHPFLERVMPAGLLQELEAQEAYGRGAEVWEVANVMVFLASDLASYMTGEVLPVSSQRA